MAEGLIVRRTMLGNLYQELCWEIEKGIQGQCNIY